MNKLLQLQLAPPTTSTIDQKGYSVDEINCLENYFNEGFLIKSITKIDVNDFGIASFLVVLEN